MNDETRQVLEALGGLLCDSRVVGISVDVAADSITLSVEERWAGDWDAAVYPVVISLDELTTFTGNDLTSTIRDRWEDGFHAHASQMAEAARVAEAAAKAACQQAAQRRLKTQKARELATLAKLKAKYES